MADAAAPRRINRRTFLGWWLASLLTATVITGVLPILVYFWPAPPKGQKKAPITVSLAEGQADVIAREVQLRSS